MSAAGVRAEELLFGVRGRRDELRARARGDGVVSGGPLVVRCPCGFPEVYRGACKYHGGAGVAVAPDWVTRVKAWEEASMAQVATCGRTAEVTLADVAVKQEEAERNLVVVEGRLSALVGMLRGPRPEEPRPGGEPPYSGVLERMNDKAQGVIFLTQRCNALLGEVEGLLGMKETVAAKDAVGAGQYEPPLAGGLRGGLRGLREG